MNPNDFLIKTFSQDGEDRLVLRIFKHKRNGFYIDIGAHHPYRFSNTALLYSLGWRGINIDATPSCIQSFNGERPNDINVLCAVSDHQGVARLKVFEEPAYNTLNTNRRAPGKERIDEGRIIEVPCNTIANLIESHVPKGTDIDFVNIDIEGSELDVLRGFPFDRVRPNVFAIEDHNIKLSRTLDSQVYRLMTENKYTLKCQGLFSSIYIDGLED